MTVQFPQIPTRYRLVLADPPWYFRNWSADKPNMVHDRERGAAKHYPTMTVEDICLLRPPVEDDAVLLLWTFPTHFEQAFEIIRAWGFEYKTRAWVWRKITKAGKLRIGMGYWTRQGHEDCLLAVRGHPGMPVFRGEPDEIEAPRGRHSEKPFEQYAKIARLFPDAYPRLEMFARTRVRGWDAFGNEIGGWRAWGDERVIK